MLGQLRPELSVKRSSTPGMKQIVTPNSGADYDHLTMGNDLFFSEFRLRCLWVLILGGIADRPGFLSADLAVRAI